MKIKVGNSWFTERGIHLDIQQDGQSFIGEVEFSHKVDFPSKWYNPGIMGWYSFVPLMECKHGIVSVTHKLKGQISLNDRITDFTGGKGYIEKDWGVSFPESWVWIHSNHFQDDSASFTFLVAKIPWMGSFFIGHICFLYTNGKFYRFATYNGSKIKRLIYENEKLEILIEGQRETLEINVLLNISRHLRAPLRGKMSRIIKESIDSTVYLRLKGKNGNVLFEESGKRAGFEMIDKILTYFI